MRSTGVQELDVRSFAPYGAFASMMRPEGEMIGKAPIIFYRDMLQMPVVASGQGMPVSFSVCQVETRDPVVDVTEFHSLAYEGILPLNEDVLIHVAAATPTADPPADKIEVFRVPRGTLVVLKPGVWHHAAFRAVHGRPRSCLPVGRPLVLPLPHE